MAAGTAELSHAAKKDETKQSAQKTSEAKPATVRDVIENSSKYVNQPVQLSGEIEETYGNFGFVVDGLGTFNDEILVVTGNKQKVKAEEGQNYQVTGTVKRMGVYDIERDFGWKLDPELEAEFEGVRTVLVLQKSEQIS